MWVEGRVKGKSYGEIMENKWGLEDHNHFYYSSVLVYKFLDPEIEFENKYWMAPRIF